MPPRVGCRNGQQPVPGFSHLRIPNPLAGSLPLRNIKHKIADRQIKFYFDEFQLESDSVPKIWLVDE